MLQPRNLLTIPNLFRVLLLLVCIDAATYLKNERPPWKSAWARHRAEGTDPSFREHLATGLWAGAAVRLSVGSALLLLSLAWTRKQLPLHSRDLLAVPEKKDMVPSCPPGVFYSLLGLMLAGSLATRLPRMTHSFWGDEADAIATYVHGMYKPLKKKDRQGPVYFEPPIWPQTLFSARHGPNNHVLYSITSRLSLEAWRTATGRQRTEFVEWAARLPSLIAGLASLAGVALLMRRWGAPWVGLLAALVMAMHPWHQRYSTEARGYALALAVVPFLLIALSHALDRGRWRAWLVVGTLQFAIMYSWAGMAYTLMALHVAVLVLILKKRDRLVFFIRWATVNLASAAAFISLYAPHVPQIEEARRRLLWIKGLPMDTVWFHNLVAEFYTGVPWHAQLSSNPGEISVEGLLAAHPWSATAGFSLAMVAFITGIGTLWRWHRTRALLVTSSFAAVVLCTLHFKFVLGDELRSWYLIFALPSSAITTAFGLCTLGEWAARLMPLRHKAVSPVLILGLAGISSAPLLPMLHSQLRLPFEDFKGVLQVTRQRHEEFNPRTSSRVLICWLWRYSALYDPRGEIQVRSAQALLARMEETKARKGELYMVVGFRALATTSNADLLDLLENSRLFEKVRTFPSRQSIQMMEVYRMK